MASILKRKRGPVEVLDAPKRSKSIKTQNGNHSRETIDSEIYWKTANSSAKDLVHTNGINGINGHSEKMNTQTPSIKSNEPENIVKITPEKYDLDISSDEEGKSRTEAMDVEIETMITEVDPKTKVKKNRSTKKALTQALINKDTRPWKLSQSIGGRMINADPVFTPDEKFLIVAKKSAIQVYATTTSLLTRSIPLSLKARSADIPRIITFYLSPSDPNLLWIACSDGTVFKVDWTTGAGADAYWTISSTGCIHMTVASMESAGRTRDVVFTTESRKDGGFRITANELYGPESLYKTDARTVYTSSTRIQSLKAISGGRVIAGAAGNKVLIGNLRSAEFGTIDKIKFEFRSFETKDAVKSLDLRVTTRPASKDTKKTILSKLPVVDVVVGDVRGVIFVYSDLAGKLFMLKDGSAPGFSLVPQKHHWHRKAVHTVKWSLDGNYIISGGTETVLVLWQLDTGKQQFLPHMGATIQNVAVSPSGTSYAVQLSDNSAMILSTADLAPKTNIAGIQASVIVPEPPIEAQVMSIGEVPWPAPLIQRTPIVVNPTTPFHLLLAVGQAQGVRPYQSLIMSNPFLQTFDLGTNHSVHSQALTRTNITNLNVAPGAHNLIEPRVIHMKISNNGEWLATVDEWVPPNRDFEFLNHQNKDGYLEYQQRREVHLKFWQWSSDSCLWKLVSRIDAPHLVDNYSTGAGRILDLVADPSSLRFATIGSDGTVRIWSTKSRKQDGIILKGSNNNILVKWHCLRTITLSKPELRDEYHRLSIPPNTGSISFSEDGSILAAAFGRDKVLHLIDPESGTIRDSRTGLVENEVLGLECLGQYLIILSDHLIVFDVVSEEVRFAFRMESSIQSLLLEQKMEMIHLAVDTSSRTFAIALPKLNHTSVHRDSLVSASSELIVFHQDHPTPRFTEVFSTLITALVPSIGSEGYLALDASAEIHTILQKGLQAITALAQSTSALQLDSISDELTVDLAEPTIDDEEKEDEEEAISSDVVQDRNTPDGDDEFPVVTQQQLSEVFDVGPAFALPPIEELFYHVAGLFSSKSNPSLPLRARLDAE